MKAGEGTIGAGEPIEDLRARIEAESRDGFTLLRNPEENPVCSITVAPSIPGLVVVWKRYATITQLRFVHEYIIGLLKKHGLSKILGDDTGLAAIQGEDQQWIAHDWPRRAVAAGLRVGATKKPTSHFAKMSVNNVLERAPKDFAVRSFESVEAAREWLRAQPA